MIGEHQEPGTPETPTAELPAIRLYPPNVDPKTEEAWFIEFLTVPQDSKSTGKEWIRLTLPLGDFGLPTFRFLSLTAFDPLSAGALGIRTQISFSRRLARSRPRCRKGNPRSSQKSNQP